jgi:hypothetical protein
MASKPGEGEQALKILHRSIPLTRVRYRSRDLSPPGRGVSAQFVPVPAPRLCVRVMSNSDATLFVTTGLDPVVHAEMQPIKPAEGFAAAWIAGTFAKDGASRLLVRQ